MSVYKNTKLSEFKQTIDSIKYQTLLPNQIVLVIDGPISKSMKLYINNRLRNIVGNILLSTFIIPYNSGLPNALNHGMHLVKYNLIARVDTDDILSKDRFYKQLHMFKIHSKLAISSGYVMDFKNRPGDLSAIRKIPISYKDIIKFGKRRNPLNHPTVMIRTKILYALNGYPNFHLFEDYALWITAISRGYQIMNIPSVLTYMRFNSNSLKRRGGLKYFRNYIRLEKYFYSLNYISSNRLFANLILMFFNSILPVRIKSYIYNKFLRK